MKRNKLFRPPHLYDAGGDLAKPWWIEYGYRDPVDGKMKRKRYQDGFQSCKTKKARYALAEELIKEITAKLLRGWIPSDDASNQVVYDDQLEYHQAAQVYGRKRKANADIRYYASEYINLMKNSKAKKTWESYRGKLREFVAWLEKNKHAGNDISTITNSVILEFFDHLIIERKLAGNKIGKYKIVLQRFFNNLIDRNILLEQPVKNIELPETDEDFSAIPFLDDDLERLLPTIRDQDPQLFMAAMLQYFCFIRPGDELLKLQIKNINFAAKKIHIPKNNAKRRVDRNIDMPIQLYKLLIDQGIQNYSKDLYLIGTVGRPGVNPIGYNTLRERFNRFRDKLGLTDSYKWYSFKHTGAGKLLESGATIIELMNQLGHNDISSTYRYIRRHFGEQSEHIRTSFPSPSGFDDDNKKPCIRRHAG